MLMQGQLDYKRPYRHKQILDLKHSHISKLNQHSWCSRCLPAYSKLALNFQRQNKLSNPPHLNICPPPFASVV